MKRNKKLSVLAIAGALTAATAVPALALENEFHGAFSAYYDLSNYTAAGNDSFEPTTKNATGLQKDAPTENYFVQRVRLAYIGKASDNVKLVTQFELDYSYWGNSSYATKRNQGGALGADTVNIETKHLYLDLSYPQINARIGMQPNSDIFKGTLFYYADMAGVLLSHQYTNAGVAAGFFRFADSNDAPGNTKIGRNTHDMMSLDAKYNLSKDVKLGAAYYYINDNHTTGNPAFKGAKVHTAGVSAEAAFDALTLNGFALGQFGDLNDNKRAKGYAFNVGAKVPVAGGTARSEFLYVPGGENALYIARSDNGGPEPGGFYDSEMIMLNQDKNAKTIATAIVYDSNNYDQGVIMGSLGFDYPFTPKLTGSANAGFGAVASNKNTTNASTSDYLGTELNLEANYKLNANTTIGIRGGYVFLGDYFNGLNADNPYDFKILANYAF